MKKLLVLSVLVALAVGGLFAQTTAVQDLTIVIPQIRIIRLLTDSMITLTVGSSITPGATPGNVDSSSQPDFLQYTVLNPTGTTQHITAAITSGTVPNGLALSVAASGGSLGNIKVLGSPLSGTGQELIGEIGSGYTGTGATQGMLLTYTLSVTDATQLLVNAGADIDVTYTIGDDA